jgi:hypothetical protein
MIAIDNANLTDYRGDQGVAGFNPAVTFSVSGANVTLVDGSTIPVGDTLQRVHIKLQDGFGGEVRGAITVTGAPGQQVLSSSTLNTSRGLKLVATVLTTKGIAADGSAVNIGTSGSLRSWDIQKNATA